MRFIPDYRVCYKGRFYECGEEFDIDPADAEEMSEHGEVVDEPTPPVEEPAEETEEPAEETEEPADKNHRRGRPRRADNDQSGKDEATDG